MTLKKFDVVEVHMHGDENLKDIRFMGIVLDDKTVNQLNERDSSVRPGGGKIKVLAITPEPFVITVSLGPGFNNQVRRCTFKAALINEGGFASLLTDVSKWEFPS